MNEVQRKLEDKRWPLFISFLAITALYLLISVPNLNSTGSSNTEFSFQSILGAFIMKIFENSIMWLGSP